MRVAAAVSADDSRNVPRGEQIIIDGRLRITIESPL